jgi:uncharacterized membrane protein
MLFLLASTYDHVMMVLYHHPTIALVAGVVNTGLSVSSISFIPVCGSEKVAGVTKKGDSNCDSPATGVCSIGSTRVGIGACTAVSCDCRIKAQD